MTNSFTKAITRFKLVAGLVDTDIKEDILSMSDMNLEETVKAVEGTDMYIIIVAYYRYVVTDMFGWLSDKFEWLS